MSSLKKDLEAIKSKYNETSEKLMEKTRQYQKLQVNGSQNRIILPAIFSIQGMYESLRRLVSFIKILFYNKKCISFLCGCRRNINPSSLDGDTTKGSPRGHHPLKPHPFELPIGSISERTGMN